MSSKASDETVYEFGVRRGRRAESPNVMIATASVVRRSKTVKVSDRHTGDLYLDTAPDLRDYGGPAVGLGSTYPIERCDFDVESARARFIAQLDASIAGHEKALAYARDLREQAEQFEVGQ